MLTAERMLSMYSVIWSSHFGHHLWGATDKAGKTYYIESPPIPKWSHLLMRPGAKTFRLLEFWWSRKKEPEPALSLLRSDVPGARGNAARCGVSPYRSAPTRKERIDFVKQANNRLPDDTRRYYPLTPSDDEPLKRRIGIVVRLPGPVDQRPQAHVQRSPIDGQSRGHMRQGARTPRLHQVARTHSRAADPQPIERCRPRRPLEGHRRRAECRAIGRAAHRGRTARVGRVGVVGVLPDAVDQRPQAHVQRSPIEG